MSSSVETGRLKTTMNRADGAGVEQQYFNATDKELKYLTFVYVPYNRVGDPVQCTMSRKSEVSCKITGPIEPYLESTVKWDTLWYNPTIVKVELVRIHVDYMDGTKETIDGADVVTMSDKQSVYYEKIGKAKEAEAAEREKQRAIENAEAEKRRAIESAEEEKRRAERARKRNLMEAYKCYKVFNCLKRIKGDEEMAFHASQGLWLFIIEVIAVICLFVVPVIGPYLGLSLIALSIYLSIMGAKGIENDKRFEIPLIGKIKLFK